MKFIRLILLSGIVFFVLACIVSFFIPAHIRVLRMVSIANSNDRVLNKVRDLAQWKSWYPGFENIELKNVKMQNGRVVEAAAGDILLSIKASTDSAVVVSMQKGARSVISGWQVNKDYRKDSLALQGYIDLRLKWYPWEKFSSLLLDKNYGETLAQGLRNLKE
ncbi:SRPBCC family protein [Niabella aquatica]